MERVPDEVAPKPKYRASAGELRGAYPRRDHVATLHADVKIVAVDPDAVVDGQAVLPVVGGGGSGDCPVGCQRRVLVQIPVLKAFDEVADVAQYDGARIDQRNGLHRDRPPTVPVRNCLPGQTPRRVTISVY